MSLFLLFSIQITTSGNTNLENPNHKKYIFNLQEAEISSDCPITKRKCVGIKEWKNGDRYEGEFRFGTPNGKGRFTWADGAYYDGEIYMGDPHGYGKFDYADGESYEGEWYEGLKSGKGLYKFATGQEYYGDFEDDEMLGEGSILFTNGESYSGQWEESLPHGQGIHTRIDRSFFDGNMKKGKRTGEGIIIWETGDTLKGTWENGKLVDKAFFHFNDGSTMLTFWEDGVALESSIYTTPNGKKFKANNIDFASQIITKDLDLMESVEQNLQLACYGMAMEYNSNQNYDLAKSYLEVAVNMMDDRNEGQFSSFVNDLLTDINTEQERSGVASIKKEE